MRCVVGVLDRYILDGRDQAGAIGIDARSGFDQGNQRGKGVQKTEGERAAAAHCERAVVWLDAWLCEAAGDVEGRAQHQDAGLLWQGRIGG